MKRTRIKAMSKKKRQEIAETKGIRSEYIKAGLPCEYCGLPATECHEITAGAHRHLAVRQPHAQLYLCRDCHTHLQGTPFNYQVAVKVRCIIRAVNRCCGRKAVTVASLTKELAKGAE